jgi:hypothetical protein
VAVVTIAAGFVRAATSQARMQFGDARLPVEKRRRLGEQLLAEEPAWRREARREFPGDDWSQDDDLHHRQAERILDIVGQRHLRVGDVVLGVDEAMRDRRAQGVPVVGGIAPHKPRPFYD